MKKYIQALSMLLLAVALLISCAKKTTQTVTTRDFAKEGFMKATVVDMTGLDGCTLMLQLENGDKLEVLNLKDEFKKDKLNVWVKYTEVKQGMSICMAGKMVKIISMELRK